MKKTLLITLFAILIIAPFTSVEAQIEIPAFNVELTGTTTTFIENHPPLPFMAAEERKAIVTASDDSPSTTAWINIIVYKMDASVVYGPFNVYEGSDFEMDIDENEWGVDIISYSAGAEVSVWIE